MADFRYLIENKTEADLDGDGKIIGDIVDVGGYDLLTYEIENADTGSCTVAIEGKYKNEPDTKFRTLYHGKTAMGVDDWSTYNLMGLMPDPVSGNVPTWREFQLAGINNIRAVVSSVTGSIAITVKLGATHRS